jgi:preprotein translocase subunit SecY
MFKAFLNIWRIGDLRRRIFFTVAMLAIYRIGFFIPLPGVDQAELREWGAGQKGSAADMIAFMGIFTGGSLSQSTIFGLGIAPYISASIIFQLLATVLPSLQQLRKEGPRGQQKIQEYTRYVTIPLCLVQAAGWMMVIQNQNPPMVYPEYVHTFTFWVAGLTALTAGTMFLMWLGEQIDKYGIGNGISLIITAGILARMYAAVEYVATRFSLNTLNAAKPFHLTEVLLLGGAFILVVAGSIVITQGQRRIPIQQAKHARGRRVVGGQRAYLPLRVNHGGVMPIIFASSLMIFPSMIFSYLAGYFPNGFFLFLRDNFSMNEGGFLYVLCYIALIYFFAFFWTTVQFQPKEMATNLRDHGSFIPGLRPGPRTAEYLETVMERITYVGAGFLAVIAVIPTLVAQAFKIPYFVAAFLGGTGLLICVSVMLDLVQRIDASLLMRNYQGFLGSKAIRGPRGG